MKRKFVLITTFSTLFISGFAQPNTHDPRIDKEYEMNQYLLKAKRQKTAAWICLGGGVVLATTGLAIGVAHATTDVFVTIATFEESHQDYTGETVLMLLGGAGIVTSIPLFIASGNNRQKARLLLTNQKTIGLVRGASKNIPGLTVSISL